MGSLNNLNLIRSDSGKVDFADTQVSLVLVATIVTTIVTTIVATIG